MIFLNLYVCIVVASRTDNCSYFVSELENLKVGFVGIKIYIASTP